MPDVRDGLRDGLQAALEGAGVVPAPVEIAIERPRDRSHGEWSSNVALAAAKAASRPPRQLAEQIVAHLSAEPPPHVVAVEAAGPGFVNFRLAPSWLHEVLAEVIAAGVDGYARSDLGSGRSVSVEFVSANPTGPLHAGHGRWAAYGDSLCRLLEHCGYRVTREFYVNDRGRQIDLYTASLAARSRGEEPPDDGYHGDYVAEWAAEMPAGADARRWGLERARRDQTETLAAMNVAFDLYTSESTLVGRGAMDEVLGELRDRAMVYEQDGAVWLRTGDLGDSADRVVVKSDSEPTYFLPDIAYHHEKFSRGDLVIDILGADHHGYVPRMRAALAALGHDREAYEAVIGQNVTLRRGGVEVRLSKRAGDMVIVSELLDEVGPDVTRLVYLLQSIDTTQTIDIDVDVDGLGRVDGLQQVHEPGHVRTDLVEQLRDDHHVARSLRQPYLDPAPAQGHVLADHSLICLTVMAERGQSGPHARDVAVVVGTENVDHEIAPGELLVVVGDVGEEVGGLGVALDDHPIGAVAEVSGAEPHRAVLLVDHGAVPQLAENLIHRSPANQRGLAGVEVESHVHGGQGLGLIPAGPLQPPPAGVGASGHLGRPLGHIVAVVAVVGRLLPSAPGRQRGRVQVDLAAAVVHVELPGHPVAAVFQQPAQRVAVGGPPSVAGVQRAGRVGRHELHAHRAARAQVAAGVAVDARSDDLSQHLVQPARGQAEVHEARPGGLDRHNMRGRLGTQVSHDLLGELAGWTARRLGCGQRHIRRPLAVGAVPGPFDGDLDGRGDDAGSFQSRLQPVPQAVANIRHRPILPGGPIPAGEPRADSMAGPAPVAQGIEQRPPEPCAQVRILPGAHDRHGRRACAGQEAPLDLPVEGTARRGHHLGAVHRLRGVRDRLPPPRHRLHPRARRLQALPPRGRRVRTR